MSYDRQLDQICQHTVVNETLYMEGDQRTINPTRSIASGSNVRLIVNGDTEVPPSGLRLPPSATGVKSGPFRIVAGVNDRFQVRVNQSQTVREVVIPAATLTVDQIIRPLNEARMGLTFFNQNNRVGFRANAEGATSSLFIPSTATLASTLGMAVNLEYRGKDLYSPWSLVATSRTNNLWPYRYIVFDRPLRSSGDFVQLTYTTVQQECRRCGGVGVENDWRYTRTGDVVEVRDEALLIQECLKLFYTEEGSNPFHAWYGTRLIDQIGQKITVGGLVQNLIVSDIYRAFNRWQSIKRQQEVAVGQDVSDEEYPFRLLSVDVAQSSTDPTVFFVTVNVQNRSAKSVVINRGLRIPEPQDLLGSTQQQGLLRQSLQNYVLTG